MSLGRAHGALRDPGNLRSDPQAPDHASLRQHPQPGRNALPGALAGQRSDAADRAASRLAGRRPAPAGGERRWRQTACARSSPPRRSISASTGAMSISSFMSVRRKEPAGLPSASAARTIAWTSRRRHCLFRPTASRCSSAAQRWRPTISARRIRRRCSTAPSTSCPSTCWAAPAARLSTRTNSTTRSSAPRLTPASTGRPSTASSISWRPAVMRCEAMSATRKSARRRRARGAYRIRVLPSNTG